ncbi:MAG TPA: DUF1385 domain-containing protein [Bryobacteraceae bacterium]|nr:DUF1385 domain-containing protein [Bryobacteraceae bacterium]
MSFHKFVRLAAHLQMLPVLESGEETLVGGQAVMEGVMMRAPHSYCVAVRKPSGEIVTQEHALPRLSEQFPVFRWPLLRGIGTLGQAMKLGVRALRFSANAAMDTGKEGAGKDEVPGWMMALNIAFSLGFFIFLYKFVPLWITTEIGGWFPAFNAPVLFNLTDGIIRVAIFLAFLLLISRWQDIRRVFEYHGAEHRVVFNFESGRPVNIENARSFRTFHPRCGTSFLLVVMVISIAVYALVPVEGFLAKFVARILLLPVIAGLSYEMIRFAAKRQGGLLSALTAPGLWLQRVTTKVPDDRQTEVAIHALDRAMEIEKAHGGELVVA